MTDSTPSDLVFSYVIADTIGPCTDNSNVTIKDGACALPQEDQEEMYCQLQSTSRNLCVDINGESPYAGTNLIGWECSGQWNQLFRIMSNCTVSAVQPDLIGRVRGFEERNISMCFQPDHHLHVVSAECEPAEEDLLAYVVTDAQTQQQQQQQQQRQQQQQQQPEAQTSSAESESRRRLQRFEFMKKDGQTHKQYEKAPPKKSLDTMRDAVGTPRETNDVLVQLNSKKIYAANKKSTAAEPRYASNAKELVEDDLEGDGRILPDE